MKFSSNRVTVADTFSKKFKFRDTRKKNDKNGPKASFHKSTMEMNIAPTFAPTHHHAPIVSVPCTVPVVSPSSSSTGSSMLSVINPKIKAVLSHTCVLDMCLFQYTTWYGVQPTGSAVELHFSFTRHFDIYVGQI